jgi:hypothetical protein
VATFHAAAAIGEALAKVLERSVPAGDEFFAETTFSFVHNFRSPPRDGVTLYFYRVATSGARHNFPQRTTRTGELLKRSLPLDFYYMLTAWGRDARRQAALLVWAIRALEDAGVLHAATVNEFYGTTAPPLRGGEDVHLSFETLTLQDQVNIWEIAKQSMQPSVGCSARAVPIETTVVEQTPPPTQTREFVVEEVQGG